MGVDVVIFERKRQIAKGIYAAVVIYLTGNSCSTRYNISTLNHCSSVLNARDMKCEKHQKIPASTGIIDNVVLPCGWQYDKLDCLHLSLE